MLLLHPAILACGLSQLLTHNFTISINDVLVFARVGTAATIVTNAAKVAS
jgi:hypothetical protein